MGRKLLDFLCLSAVCTLVKFMHTAMGLELMPGVVAVIQTFDRIIRYLELTFEAEQPPLPDNVQPELVLSAEESGEYF